MAYQNRKQNNSYVYGWGSTEYQVYEPAVYNPPHHHHPKKVHHVTYEEPISRAESYTERRFGENNNNVYYENVNQEADAFIQHEHKRMELARLRSSMYAD